MENALRELQRVEVDALYGKKAHFNAADRKRGYHTTLGVAGLVVSVVTGSALFGVVSEMLPEAFGWVALVLTLVTALLTAVQTFFGFDGKASAHAGLASRFLTVAKKARRFRAYAADGDLSPADLHAEIERLAAEYADITRDAEANPFAASDYAKAKQGFNDGEEEYTPQEMAR